MRHSQWHLEMSQLESTMGTLSYTTSSMTASRPDPCGEISHMFGPFRPFLMHSAKRATENDSSIDLFKQRSEEGGGYTRGRWWFSTGYKNFCRYEIEKIIQI